MTFCTINGVTIPTAADAWEEEQEEIGSVEERGLNSSLTETHVGRVRTFTAACIPKTPAEGLALEKLINGDGQRFSYASNVYSSKGVAPKSGGSYALAAAVQHDGSVEVASASFIEYALANKMSRRNGWAPTDGWSLLFFENATGSHYAVTGAVAVTRGASSGNPAGVTQYEDGVAGSYGVGNFLDLAADGDVGLHGYSYGGGAGAKRFDNVVALPFALPSSTWAAALYAFHAANPWPSMRQVTLSGDCVSDEQVTCIGRARRIKVKQLVIDGTRYNNARAVAFELIEV